jgi:hypothetical protein
MGIQLQTALIAAVVALATALLSSYITWRLERRKWLTGLKASLQVELPKGSATGLPGRVSGPWPVFLICASASDAANRRGGRTRVEQMVLLGWRYDGGTFHAGSDTRAASAPVSVGERAGNATRLLYLAQPGASPTAEGR